MAEERDGGGRLAPRPLRPAERHSVRCYWLSWRGPPPSPPPSQPAVGALVKLALAVEIEWMEYLTSLQYFQVVSVLLGASYDFRMFRLI